MQRFPRRVPSDPSRRLLLAAAAASLVGPAAAQPPSSALAALVEGGSVALMRHARAPGTGDPPGFRLGACETQRNLDETGRLAAAEAGRKLRAAGVLVTQARSSRWCRALETAALAFPDVPTVPDAALDSFFADAGGAPRQTRTARAMITRWAGRQGVLALVTHAVNVAALTGVDPAEGEIVVLRPRRDGFDVAGRWR